MANYISEKLHITTFKNGDKGTDGADIRYIYYRTNTPVQGENGNTGWEGNGPDAAGGFEYAKLGETLNNNWTDSPLGIDENNKYEYVSIAKKPAEKDAKWGDFQTPIIWSRWGDKGEDGDGVEYKYRRYANKQSSTPSYDNSSNWTDDPLGVDADNRCEYVCQLKTIYNSDEKKWEVDPNSAKVSLWNEYKEDGKYVYAALEPNEIRKSTTTQITINLMQRIGEGEAEPCLDEAVLWYKIDEDNAEKEAGAFDDGTYIFTPSETVKEKIQFIIYNNNIDKKLIDKETILALADGETAYYLYHNKTTSGAIPDAPASSYTQSGSKDENQQGWYDTQRDYSVYQTYKVCAPSQYSTTAWGPVRRISGELTTYDDLWNALENESSGGEDNGIYSFIDNDGKNRIGINADLIKVGAIRGKQLLNGEEVTNFFLTSNGQGESVEGFFDNINENPYEESTTLNGVAFKAGSKFAVTVDGTVFAKSGYVGGVQIGYVASTEYVDGEVAKASTDIEKLSGRIFEVDDKATTAVSTATTAVNTANTAASAANEAAGVAQQAGALATNANNNASSAVTTANSAANTANTAVETAETANNNAQSAVTTANTAINNATSAQNTANVAATTAQQASVDAASASSKANEAIVDAASAKTTAGEAVETAGKAEKTAEGAKTTAEGAKTTAEDAAKTAGEASNKADAAQGAAAEAKAAADEAKKYAESEIKELDDSVQNYLFAGSKTLVGDDYVISPYLGGGYLNITHSQDTADNNKTRVIIDPSNLTKTDQVFAVYDQNGEVAIGFSKDGNAVFAGCVKAESGHIGGWAVQDDGIYKGTDGVYSGMGSVRCNGTEDLIIYEGKFSVQTNVNTNTCTILGIEDDNIGEATSLVIPSEIGGCEVTAIKDEAFRNYKTLKSITIPNSVTSIGFGAFYGCSNLTSVIIPDSVTSIGGSAFRSCSNLTSVAIGNNVTSIGSYAFAWCSNLTSVAIGNGITSIEWYAFWDCSSLKTVFYTGSAEQWSKISIESNNDCLKDATIRYNASPIYAFPSLSNAEKTSPPRFFAGSTTPGVPNILNGTNPNFMVLEDGSLYASAADIRGKITATSLDLGENKISTTNIDGLSPVATTGNYSDLSDVPTIPTSVTQLAGGTNILYSGDVQISASTTDGITTQTITYGNNTYTTKTSQDGKYVLTDVGLGEGSNSPSSTSDGKYFCVSTDGLLTANNAIINGEIYATSGKFTGEVVAGSGSIGGEDGWKIGTKKITTGTFGADGGFHMYSSGYSTTDASETKTYFGQSENKTWALGIGSNFGVTTDGELYAQEVIEAKNIAETANGTATKAQTAASAAQSTADGAQKTAEGKMTVYNQIPDSSITPKEGDLLIPAIAQEPYSVGKVYRWIRVDNTDGTVTHEWAEVEYTDDTVANEAKIVAAEARSHADSLIAGGVTQIDDKYVISPYIGGGYLNIAYTQEGSENKSRVIIDPNDLTGQDKIFAVYDQNGDMSIGFDEEGNATFAGHVEAKTGSVGGWTIGNKGIYAEAVPKNTESGEGTGGTGENGEESDEKLGAVGMYYGTQWTVGEGENKSPVRFYAGYNNNTKQAKFVVTENGHVHATDAIITTENITIGDQNTPLAEINTNYETLREDYDKLENSVGDMENNLRAVNELVVKEKITEGWEWDLGEDYE